MAILVFLIIAPPVCAVLLIAYRIWPREGLYGAASAVWLALLVTAFAGLIFAGYLNIAVDPRGGWDSIGAGLLTIYSLPLLISGALALFLKPPSPPNEGRW
jgi:hypothetical protein